MPARAEQRGVWGPPCFGGAEAAAALVGSAPPSPAAGEGCHSSYPGVCITGPPRDLDCGEIPLRRFPVFGPDPHGFDGNRDRVGCDGRRRRPGAVSHP